MIDLLRSLLGEALTEEMIEKIEAYLAEHYVTKEEYEAALSAKDSFGTATEKTEPAASRKKEENAVEDFYTTSGIDEEQLFAIKAEVETEVQAEYEERLYAIEFDYAVNIALLQIGVIDLDLVKVKLDMSKLSMNENGEINGLEEQVEEIRRQFPMLFAERGEMLPKNFYGWKPLVGQKNYTAITREDIRNMNYKERLALLKSNPSLYHALVG